MISRLDEWIVGLLEISAKCEKCSCVCIGRATLSKVLKTSSRIETNVVSRCWRCNIMAVNFSWSRWRWRLARAGHWGRAMIAVSFVLHYSDTEWRNAAEWLGLRIWSARARYGTNRKEGNFLGVWFRVAWWRFWEREVGCRLGTSLWSMKMLQSGIAYENF